MNNIALYCGSFSPLHNGHIRIINEVLKQGLADKLIVVATFDYWNKKISIPYELRLKCLKTIEDENIIIDDDIKDSSSSSTYELLKRLEKKYPNSQFKLVLGADNLASFSLWINYKYLLEHYPFVIMKRNDYDIESKMKELNKKDYVILDCEQCNVSSSFIRSNINNHLLIKDLLPEKVLKILKAN